MLIDFSILLLIIISVYAVILLIIKLTNNEHTEAVEPTNGIALATVVPGTILSKQNNTDNPFENEKGQIKVIDIKKNGKNEIWIKYTYIQMNYFLMHMYLLYITTNWKICFNHIPLLNFQLACNYI